MDLNWSSIRALNGSQRAGFEELCAQLASAERPDDTSFERKGTPDAGVEGYAVLPDGVEWGWQAKYFLAALGDTQWQQIDESVRTALDKHPRLVKYHVCVPRDRSDGRVERKVRTPDGSTTTKRDTSERDRWDEHKENWESWATERGMAVEFVYWGSHEMFGWLSQPQHAGKVRFWFDGTAFDDAWFHARLDEALHAAGPRYTPEINVDLPIAAELEAFGRTDRFVEELRRRAQAVKELLWSVTASEDDAQYPRLTASVAECRAALQAVMESVAAIDVAPSGAVGFGSIVEKINSALVAVGGLRDVLAELEALFDQRPADAPQDGVRNFRRRNPYLDRRLQLQRLVSGLPDLLEVLDHARGLANGGLMLLKGNAGTGKTHLLCDVASNRLSRHRPTVLLMGQRLRDLADPWLQAMAQLDLTGCRADEFVGALEAAAQAADCRALVLIDALNEGVGRELWPDHLAAFVHRLQSSPWVAVVASVRSSYLDVVVPDDVQQSAIVVEHRGFADVEYDAAKTFFVYYGLELPSAPLLLAEYANPLFLKTLCRGLQAAGERRLPRGAQGIVAIFERYLGALEHTLSREYLWDAKQRLLRKALDRVVEAMLASGEDALPREQAKRVVDELLPGREYQRSLFFAMVQEGLLADELWEFGEQPTDAVYIGYERLSDYLKADRLLQQAESNDTPVLPLAEGKFLLTGLLEALCTLAPERKGCELSELAPAANDAWGFADAFRQSIVWREPTAFFEETEKLLWELSDSNHDWDDTLDTLLTVALLPGHPLNLDYLDRLLRGHPLPERDAWWTTFLHRAWQGNGALRRVVDWSTDLPAGTALDDETVDLCAGALAWMLPSSNRYLRDRATQALVNLLTDRLAAAQRLVDRFADVDDLYVVERVYAVAYGVAMRSHEAAAVGDLARCVYRHVFEDGRVPAHILLRDYARGVVERALHLGAELDIDLARARPPYDSAWPKIPTEAEVEPFLPDWSRGSYDSGEAEWSRNCIGSSVMNGDFARYIIGTNSDTTSRRWLALRLDEPAWSPPPSREDLADQLFAELSDSEQKAWEECGTALDEAIEAHQRFLDEWWDSDQSQSDPAGSPESPEDRVARGLAVRPPELLELEERWRTSDQNLTETLSEDHRQRLEAIRKIAEDAPRARPPGLGLGQLQRYVLWRVFDLGWTTERFGYFERYYIRHSGRTGTSEERIGKKYQWLAYHEILALVADNHQYRDVYGDDGDRVYEGPWQMGLRDIDPSCTLASTPAPPWYDGSADCWWCPPPFASWDEPKDGTEWSRCCAGLPDIAYLLEPHRPEGSTRWLNLHGSCFWRRQREEDQTPGGEQRDLRLQCTGYLFRAGDAEAFLAWAADGRLLEDWMPHPLEFHEMFLGEYGWAPAWHGAYEQYCREGGLLASDFPCPVEPRHCVAEYLREDSGYDCSVREGYTLHLPAVELLDGLGLRWTGHAADFEDAEGRLTAFDPSAHEAGPGALLVRQDALVAFQEREQLSLCWAILGEKQAFDHRAGVGLLGRLVLSGACALGPTGPRGFVNLFWQDGSGRNEDELTRRVDTIELGQD